MEIMVRLGRFQDLGHIIKNCLPEGGSLEKLQRYQRLYFTESGEPKKVATGLPDEILVAEWENRIVGYLHFYTDCWDNYEKIKISLRIDPVFSYEIQKVIRESLEKEFATQEP